MWYRFLCSLHAPSLLRAPDAPTERCGSGVVLGAYQPVHLGVLGVGAPGVLAVLAIVVVLWV